jgi:hypothetical protein
MDEEYWCIQWSSEVLPEPAMIPDLSVFLRSAPGGPRSVTASRSILSPVHELQEAPSRAALPRNMPTLLRLPFFLAPLEEKHGLTIDQQNTQSMPSLS